MKALKYALLGLAGVIGMLVSMFGPVKVPFAEGLAKSYYRYALGALLLVLSLIPVAAGLFILTFDANNFKSEIIQFVKDRTQRDLVLEGKIKLTFFPQLGLDSGRASLTQRNSAKEFASINNARLHIAWLPLLRRRLVFNKMEVDGALANLARMKDGTTNFDDLLISDEHLAPLTFDIDSVRVTDSTINWLDEIESRQATLQNLQLETGRLADKLPGNLTASFRLNSENMRLSSNVNLKSRIFFDRKAGRYEFADIDGKLVGEAANINDLALNFAGSLDSYPAQGLLTAENIIVTASGKFRQSAIGSKLSISRLQVDKIKMSGNQATLDITSVYAGESAATTIQLPDFEIINKQLNAPKLTADFEVKSDGLALQGKLASALSVSFETATILRLNAIVLSVAAKHPALSGEIATNATGSVLADFDKQNVNLRLNAKIDESKITGNVAMKDFSHPAYTFEINASRLDLDRYLADDWLKRFQEDATTLDFNGLKDVILHGSLHADEFKLAKIKATKLAAAIKIEQSRLTIEPIAAKLYGGKLTGSISVVMQGTPQISVKQNLKNFQLNALLADMTGSAKLSGKGNLSVDISSEGGSMGKLRKASNGSIALALARGSLAGIDLQKALLDGRSKLGFVSHEKIHAANFTEKTEFSELKATFNIKDGAAVGNSFELKSPTIRTAGEGDISAGSGDISYRLNATVSYAINRRTSGELAKIKGVTVPIRVSGPYAAPSITLEFGSASGGNIARLSAENKAKTVGAAKTGTAKAKTRAAKPAKK